MQFIKITVFLWFAYSSNCHTNDKYFNKNLLTKRFENPEQSSILYSNFKDDERRDIDDKNPFREKLKTSYLLPEYILKKLQILRKNDYSPKSTIGYILKSNIQPELLSKIKNLNSENPTLLRNKKGNKRAVVSQLNYSDPDENRRNQYSILKKSLEKANKKVKLKDLKFQMTISALDFLTEPSGVESKGSTPTVKNKKRISLKKAKNKNSKLTTLSPSKNLEKNTFTELIPEASFSVDNAKTLLKKKEVKAEARTKPSVDDLKSKEGTKDLEIDTFTEAGSLRGNAETLLKDKENKARTKPIVYGLKSKGGTTTVKNQEKESAIERTDIEFRSESPVTMFILEIIGDTSAGIGSESEEIGNSTDPRGSTELFTTHEYANDYGIPENGLQKFLSVSDETQPAARATSEQDEADDVTVSYGTSCDYLHNDSCWFERETGDTLTLGVNINSSRDENSFEIHWKRLYQKYNDKRCAIIKIESERLPWNMVLGSGNRELRLDPITNTDTAPNAISAEVFLLVEKGDKKLYQFIKELLFHIEVPPLDMGKVYAGEEINIYMENFLTLPEGGSYVFDWMLEGEFRKPLPLPSNFKLSTSGRSIKVKELKKFQTGIIACIMYSPIGIAVAKRRFSIQKILPRDRKRSLLKRREQDKWAGQQKRRSLHSKCLRTLSDHSAEDILKLSSKPISRKKRFRKALAKEMERLNRVTRDCKRRHLRSRLHPRWAIPFLGGYETTSDPRVMSIQKLVELSENSDGTLDNLIPREVHYVEPVVSVVTDYFRSFLKPPDFQPNCSIDADCGEGALCVIPLDQDGSSKMDNVGHKGYCYCKPEYFGDGFTCTKIPWSYHRDKRIKRRVSRRHREPKTTANAFSQIFSELSTDIQPVNEEDTAHLPYFIETSGAMLMEYEEEDSYLVSMCKEKRDCNHHASCYARKTGHPFCRCNSGYRGNGIFCWEMIDYIAAKDRGTDKAPD